MQGKTNKYLLNGAIVGGTPVRVGAVC